MNMHKNARLDAARSRADCYLDRHVFRRFAGQNTAHVERSIAHVQRLSQSFIKSQLSRAKCGRQFKRAFARYRLRISVAL